jgi:hypothetical protein
MEQRMCCGLQSGGGGIMHQNAARRRRFLPLGAHSCPHAAELKISKEVAELAGRRCVF